MADAWDVMTSDRPYRAALDQSAAMSEVHRLSGAQFCPSAVAALRAVLIEETLESPSRADPRADRVTAPS